MISTSTLKHLRIPFSIYLSPVYFFALSQAKEPNVVISVLVFVILHIFVYPASNGYNSYYDRDEGSIGGLEHPPAVDENLIWTSWMFDGVALMLSLLVSYQFALFILIYGLISKLYSHPSVRLKRYPWLGWLSVTLFQGGGVYLATLIAVDSLAWDIVFFPEYWLPALTSSVLFGGAYPLTQIYQHEEDASRDDRTLSRILGIRGTFVFSALTLLLANWLFLIVFFTSNQIFDFYLLQAFFVPIIVFFSYWFWLCEKDEAHADFKNTMRMNKLSSLLLICYFLVI